MTSLTRVAYQPSIGIPCFATEYEPVDIPQVLQDELAAINAIYGDGSIEVAFAYNAKITIQVQLPGIDLPALQLSFPLNYPQTPPEILDFNLPTRERTRRTRSARLIVISILQAQFVKGFECIFDLLDTCLPILSLLGDNGLDTSKAASSIPGFIADQWVWTTTENVNTKDIKALETCAVCLDDGFVFKMICLPCKHHFCLDCFQNGWAVSLESSQPFTCCQTRIDLEIIMTFNTSRTEEIRRYIRLLQERDTNFPVYCAFVSCNALIGGSKECKLKSQLVQTSGIACPNCPGYTCPRCRFPWHGGKCNEDNDVGKLMDQDVFRRCPKCGQGIQKNGGCSHMNCTACGTHFQWEMNGTVTRWS